MKHGFSLLIREYMEATEVDYEDCRNFQVVCPACYEAVFKAGSDPNGRQYLSHYSSSGSDVPDCELRVASMSAQTMTERNDLSRGQHLKLFQQLFVDLLAEQFFTDAEHRRSALKLVDAMTSRQSYRSFIRDLRPGIASMAGDDAAASIVLDPHGPYRSKSPFWRHRQKTYALSFLKHVAAPNSLRTLYFAIAMGILHQRSTAMKLGTSGLHSREGVRMMDMLMEASDTGLRRYLAGPGWDDGDPSRISIMRVTVIQALRAVLLEFPYIEAIRRAGE